MFHYATTRDYSKGEDENLEDDKDEEAYEAYWREVLEDEENENMNTENTSISNLADESREETPENITPPPKLLLRFKEVHCTALLTRETNFHFACYHLVSNKNTLNGICFNLVWSIWIMTKIHNK